MCFTKKKKFSLDFFALKHMIESKMQQNSKDEGDGKLSKDKRKWYIPICQIKDRVHKMMFFAENVKKTLSAKKSLFAMHKK